MSKQKAKSTGAGGSAAHAKRAVPGGAQRAVPGGSARAAGGRAVSGAAASAAVLESLGKHKALGMYQRMLEIREFEEQVRYLFLEGKMPGTVHQYIGQEACAVGVCSALEDGDVIASTHRPHGHALARGITMEEAAGELYGKVTGCCKGKGGSMHMGDLARGMLPAIAIVGGNLPIVAGMALAFKLRGEKRAAVSFFGDGAANEGAFHEALNAAAIYHLPAVYVCENNLYGASTAFSRVSLVENIADRACAYGIEGRIVDGMDVFAVHAAAAEAFQRARRGQGPTLLELKTFRLCGHSRRDPNNYMSKEEKEYWQGRDPIPACEQLLIRAGWLDAAGAEALKKETAARAESAIAAAQAAPEPKAEDLYQGLYVSLEVPR